MQKKNKILVSAASHGIFICKYNKDNFFITIHLLFICEQNMYRTFTIKMNHI